MNTKILLQIEFSDSVKGLSVYYLCKHGGKTFLYFDKLSFHMQIYVNLLAENIPVIIWLKK